MSEASLNDYLLNLKKNYFNSNFIAIFKEKGEWFFYKHGKTIHQEVSEATSYFLKDPSFVSYLEFVENQPYWNLSLGDSVFINKSTNFVEALEFKTRDKKNPDYQFLEIKRHLNGQIIYHNYAEVWQRSAFNYIHYQSHNNNNLLNNNNDLTSLVRNNLQNRRNFIKTHLISSEARINVLNNTVLPSFSSFLRKIKH